MRRNLLLLILLFLTGSIAAQEKHTFMLTGASFAVPANGWFELGCAAFDAKPLNKSVSGEAILQTASRMYKGTFYTKAELEAIDVFVIMHVHNQNVANTEWIKDDYNEYTESALSTNYPVAYDYVIKKYKDDCYNLKDDPTSKFYGTENGKPALIMFCTHWHDSRTTYNNAIRTLSTRWNIPLIKWDENIGFTKNVLDEDGRQPSLKFSRDTENIGGITYGWHPLTGQGQPIQQKLASIFIAEMEKIMGEIPVTAQVKAKNGILMGDEEAYVNFSFTGVSPWNLTYEVNGNSFQINNIEQTPLLVKIDIAKAGKAVVVPTAISNATTQGTVSGEAVITYAENNILPSFDTYVHNANATTAYTTSDKLELKTSTDNYSREAFISFNISSIGEDSNQVVLRLFFNDLIYSVTNPPLESHLIEVAGNTKTYSTMTWNNKPTDFTPIDETLVAPSEKGSFISWDLTEWIKEQKEANVNNVTLRLKVKSGGTGLFNFPSMEASANQPMLLIVKKTATSIENETGEEPISFYPNPFADYIKVDNTAVKSVSIYSAAGNCLLKTNNITNDLIDTSNLPSGVYLLKYETLNGSIKNQKLIKD